MRCTFPLQLIYHGRTLCFARKPRCAECKARAALYAPDKTINAGGRDLLGSRRSVTLSLIMFSRSTRGLAFFCLRHRWLRAEPQEPQSAAASPGKSSSRAGQSHRSAPGPSGARHGAQKYPANVLALSSVSGESEVWLLESP